MCCHCLLVWDRRAASASRLPVARPNAAAVAAAGGATRRERPRARFLSRRSIAAASAASSSSRLVAPDLAPVPILAPAPGLAKAAPFDLLCFAACFSCQQQRRAFKNPSVFVRGVLLQRLLCATSHHLNKGCLGAMIMQHLSGRDGNEKHAHMSNLFAST